jgi:hypothetical protein
MAFTLEAFSTLRPYLYHLTSRENVARILATRKLESARRLIELAGQPAILRARRRDHVRLHLPARPAEEVLIRDQAPLHAGNMTLEGGWTFDRFLESLNSRVFFWPGNAATPISYGKRHFQRYEHERPVILQIPTADFLVANAGSVLEFCRYNSGSPRCSYGKGSPRGPQTFVPADAALFRGSEVVEVTAVDQAQLPATSAFATGHLGGWKPLWP